MINIKSSLIKLGDITMFSKGEQINGDLLIKDGQYDYLNGGINPSGKWNSYNVAGNTITISEGGNSSGYVNYMSNNFWCGAHCYYLYNTLCDRKYLYYSLKSQQNRLMGIRSGACMPNIKKNDLANFMLKFHEDDKVQKKIAEIFTELDTCISIKEKQLNNLTLFVKSRFIEMFGNPVQNYNHWKQYKLKDVTSKIGSGATPRGGKESYPDEGISFIRSMNVHDGYFEFKDLAHLNDDQAMALNTVTIEKNDVLINITGASVARTCVVPEQVLPARVNQHVSIIRCLHDVVNPVFINRQFLDSSFKRHLLNMGESGGATRQAITKQQLEEMLVIVPPIVLQNQFADFVAQVDKSKLAIQQSLDELETLKKSLMQQYFG